MQSKQQKKQEEMMKKQMQMQWHIQQETWKREDTAVQRRMKDLEQAGINPLMAGGVGGAASGGLVSLPGMPSGYGESAAGNALAGAGAKLQDAALRDKEIGSQDRLNQATIEKYGAEITEINSMVKNNEAMTNNFIKDLEVKDIQMALMESQVRVEDAQAKQIKALTQKHFADITHQAAQERAIEEQIRKSKSERKRIGLESTALELQNKRNATLGTLMRKIDEIAGQEGIGAILIQTLLNSSFNGVVGTLGDTIKSAGNIPSGPELKKKTQTNKTEKPVKRDYESGKRYAKGHRYGSYLKKGLRNIPGAFLMDMMFPADAY